ncbi:Icc-related predicted phosphoesterase [Amycolatopsis sulphurea]|uniref:Icc-related predicted phosphoesterase n=1 Tax=Amycolatopsis sulphurea TaxID=76022 RepID=A0A2A9F5B4_9PSEU|nr:metallophosphoesterase [Amycolatopsis sulphurea]PFG46348.1 Icc-related predicted phosphoesterase [Amycolatopsis sulphurea]
MRVHVVSDVHGNADALKRAGDGADALVVLGDLLDFVDYHDHDKGIMGVLFGADKVGEFARLRREGTREDTVAYSRTLWTTLADPAAAVDEAIREQYAALFAAMTAPTYATPGNVDAPALWPEFTGSGVQVLDGEAAVIGGLRFGFVGGAVLPEGVVPRPRKGAAWRPYLRVREEFDEAVAGLADLDVLCTHIPPAVPELTYDVIARRSELGSQALLRLIRRQQPRWSLFGHVHQPLAARRRVGHTECRNVGHFKETGQPYVLRW